MIGFRILIMIIILLVATIFNGLYFKITADDPEIIRIITKVRRELDQNQLAESRKMISQIRNRWEQKRPWLRLNIPRATLNEISTEIAVLEEAMEIKDIRTIKIQTRKLKDLWQDLRLYQ